MSPPACSSGLAAAVSPGFLRVDTVCRQTAVWACGAAVLDRLPLSYLFQT